jgi:hypothetical protein
LGVVGALAKKQIPPLRIAPVVMTRVEVEGNAGMDGAVAVQRR